MSKATMTKVAKMSILAMQWTPKVIYFTITCDLCMFQSSYGITIQFVAYISEEEKKEKKEMEKAIKEGKDN